MFPQVQSAFLNWMSTTQMQVVNRTVSDFEVEDNVQSIISFEGVLQIMKPQDVQRKPEGLREWKFWELWTTQKLQIDVAVQIPEGTQFKVQSVSDWSQGGFMKYDLVEQPVNLA